MLDPKPAADEGMVAELREAAERLLADKEDHARTRALRRTVPGHDADLWRTITELGWLAILVPADDGGIGLGLAEMAAVVQTLEKGLLAGPLVELSVLGVRTLVHAGASKVRSELLAGTVDGSVRLALALGAADAMPDVQLGGAAGTPRLHGECASVAGGHAATHLLVPAYHPDGVQLYVLPVETPGLSLATRWRADGSPLATAAMTSVVVDEGLLIATGTNAELAISTALDETRVVAAAGLLGLGERMLDMTIDYLKLREQFGQPIGSFQVLQHKAVDLYIQLELVRAAVGFALRECSDGGRLDLAALRSKGRASAAVPRIARESIQLHGAIGYTEEHDLGLYVKRALTLAGWLGNASVHRRRFVQKGLLFA